jgi:hypothetical protein
MEQAPLQGLLQLRYESQGSNANLAHEMPKLFKPNPKTNPRVLRPILQGPSLKGPSFFFGHFWVASSRQTNDQISNVFKTLNSMYIDPLLLQCKICNAKGYV